MDILQRRKGQTHVHWRRCGFRMHTTTTTRIETASPHLVFPSPSPCLPVSFFLFLSLTYLTLLLSSGEAIFIGYPGASPGPTAGNSATDSKAKAMNAVDGKTTKKGQKTSDGEKKRGYQMATEPMLYVFDGLAVVYEKEMKKGQVKVRKNEILKKADGSRYTCVVYQVLLVAY